MYVSHEDYLRKQAMASMVSGVRSHDPRVQHTAAILYGEAAGFINHPQPPPPLSSRPYSFHPQVQPRHISGAPSAGADGGGVLRALAVAGGLLFLLL